MARPLLALCLLTAACAAADDAGPDLGRGADAAREPTPDAACVLGTAAHCGMCGVACPGVDDPGTRRVCSTATIFGECDLVCLGDFYDLDGALENGCEAEDGPAHGDAMSAIPLTLPDVPDDPRQMSNPRNVVAVAYGDARRHEPAPASRPLGLEDWWAVTAEGAGAPGTGMVACLGITNFPVDNELEVCVSDPGQASFLSSGCAIARGGQMSMCASPPSRGDADARPYYVRVRKLRGRSSPLAYALFLKH